MQYKLPTMKKLLFLLAIALTVPTISQAQLLDNLIKDTQNSLSRRLSQEISDRIAQELTKAVMRPIDKAFDEMLKEQYQQDSIAGNTNGRDYSSYLSSILTPVDLKDSYSFDLTLECEMTDYSKEKSTMDMLLTKDGSLIGIKQYDGDMEMFMVFDVANDVMITFSEEDGEKQVMGMPNVLKTTGALTTGMQEEFNDMEIEKTGKTKKFAGYTCDEYKIEDEETYTKAYVAQDFPVGWEASTGNFLKNMMPAIQRDKMPQGMSLYSESKTKKKNKKSKFEVKNVIESGLTLNTGDYKKIEFGQE